MKQLATITLISLGLICLTSVTALAAVEVVEKLDLWNILLAGVLIVSGWVALKGKVSRLEVTQQDLKEQIEEANHLAHENQAKLLNLKSELYEKLIKQERLLFEKVDDRIARLEGKIDRLIQNNHGH